MRREVTLRLPGYYFSIGMVHTTAQPPYPGLLPPTGRDAQG